MRRLPRVLGICLAAAVTGCSGAEIARDEPAPPEREPEAELVTYESRAGRFEVRYPSDWRRADARLTPNLADPKEILALATYEPPAGGSRCSHHPVAALEALGPDDALLVVFERQPPWSTSGYPQRKTVRLRLERNTGRFCVPDPGRVDAWMSFRDSGRAFYVLAAAGPDAPPETRRKIGLILASLRFEPRP